MTKNEVATTKPADTGLPSYLQNYGGVINKDNFDSSDVVIPRIKLLQGTSPEVQTFNDAKIGEYWHTGMDIPLGPNFNFVVADRRKKYLLSAPLEDGQGVLARADDAKTWDRTGSWQVKLKGVKQPVTWEIKDLDVIQSGLAAWGTMNPADSDSGPAATLFYDYLVFLPERLDLGPAIITLARSAIRPAKKGLNDKIKLHEQNGRPMQAIVFNASSKDEVNPDGQPYKNWSFTGAGFNMDENLFKMALEHRGSLANIKIQGEGEVEEGGRTGGTSDDGAGNF